MLDMQSPSHQRIEFPPWLLLTQQHQTSIDVTECVGIGLEIIEAEMEQASPQRTQDAFGHFAQFYV